MNSTQHLHVLTDEEVKRPDQLLQRQT